ncbi:hypothetical protein [Methylobacterium marchantiae]|uniref:Secreted protein n=1 Tax=Methylobacterium marchantiae TaxID=600331 RepID=A0ABW3WYE0_9HYPH|nr:hypothetical protein AIGOOFII_0122 [Methylobacterium marchantiae]
MRSIVGLFAVATLVSSPCCAEPAQDRPSVAAPPSVAPSSTVTAQQRRAVSDERAAEIRAVIAEARKRQDGIDHQNTNLWLRWTYAVCLGCGPMPRAFRPVRTNPLRVLVGIPAAMDDARDRRRSRRV